MKIVNRGYISVKGKQPFLDWVNAQEDEFVMDAAVEANIYLIEDDFFDVEPLIKGNFKKIFLNELESVSDDESTYPEIKLEKFEQWFDVELGNAVFDCEKGGLNAN